MNRTALSIVRWAVPWLLVIYAILAALAVLAWPWNWHYWYNYNRQVTNITYAQNAGAKNGTVLLGFTQIPAVNSVVAPCMYDGRDLFDPLNTSRDDVQSGWSITFRANGQRQTIDVPDGKFHPQLISAGDTPRVSFSFDKVVMYYDYNWDSLWTDSGSWGPKQHVINCMQALSPSDRMRIGLKGVTVYVPQGSTLAAALKQ